jgi:ribosomal protein L29
MAREDLQAVADAELVANLAARQHELVRAQFSLSMNRLQNTSSIGRLRTAVARIHTELRRREIAAGLSKNTLVTRHRAATPVTSRGASEQSGGFLAGVVDKLGE